MASVINRRKIINVTMSELQDHIDFVSKQMN